MLNARVYFLKGNSYLKTQEFLKSIDNFSLALQFSPDFAEAYHKRGSAWYGLKNYENACVDWKEACKLALICQGWNLGKELKICGNDLKRQE
ncbi:MAG: hypothetical protein HQM11_13155 [SAR324 cluster bacterium]|nr:hypothetical protein [SAR324 cluster bacterium]